METKGLKPKAKRGCPRPISYKLESDSSGSMERDPFHSSGDDADLDFVLPPNKKPATHRNDKKVDKPKKGVGAKAKKELTAAQRIQRLKRKTALFISPTQSKVEQNDLLVPAHTNGDFSPLVNVSQLSLVSEDIDQLFDQIHNGDNDTANESATIGKNIDYSIGAGNSTVAVPALSPTSAAPANPDLVKMLLELKAQMVDLTNNVTILRKQVSRVELKSSNSRAQSLNNLIDTDLLFDFEGALSREGLPFKTCIEVNYFERKLRDEEYRKKMVRVHSS